jgi:hypothetical protein
MHCQGRLCAWDYYILKEHIQWCLHLSSLRYFACLARQMCSSIRQNNVSCETIHTGAAFLLQIWQKGWSHAHFIFWLVSFLAHGYVLCGNLAPICTQYGLPLTVFTYVVGIPTLWWRIIFVFVAYCTLTFEMMAIACLTCDHTSEV